MSAGSSRRQGSVPSELAWLLESFESIESRLRTLEQPDSAQLAQTVKKLQGVVESIQQTLNDYINTQAYTKAQVDDKVANPGNIAPGSVNASGAVQGNTGRFDGGLRSTGVYGENLATGGQYRAAYVHVDGRLGYVASSERFKQDIVPAPFSPEQVTELQVVQYRYKAEVENVGDDATLEVGLIAEQVEAAGFDFLVDRDEEGQPFGVRYERLALALLPLVQSQQSRMAQLERRLDAMANPPRPR